MAGDWQIACFWVTMAGDSDNGLCNEGVSVEVKTFEPLHPEATHYLEVSFANVSNRTLSQVEVLEVRTAFYRDGHPTMSQANDYSFVPTTDNVMAVGVLDYKQTSRVTVHQNGALVWGEEPCP